MHEKGYFAVTHCIGIVWSFPQRSWELCCKIFANALAFSYQTKSAYEVKAGTV